MYLEDSRRIELLWQRAALLSQREDELSLFSLLKTATLDDGWKQGSFLC